jgi:hypothetical protein
MIRVLQASLASVTLLGCGATCVARGTRIRTPRGDRAVEELQPGDEVFCVDPDTGARVAGTLEAIRVARRECVRLDFGEGSLICTPDHPLYDPVSRAWADAGDWALGRRSTLLHVPLEVTEAPRRLDVGAHSTGVGVREVFDLTVAHPLHNFVAEGVLVHNKSPIPRDCRLPDGGYGFLDNAPRCGASHTCGEGETFTWCGPPARCACALPDGGVAEDGGTP